MGITLLSSENIEGYAELLTPDVAENLTREHYRGIVLNTGNGMGAMVWELLNAESDKPTESIIRYVTASDEEAMEDLLDSYSDHIETDQVTRSSFELDNASDVVRNGLAEAGFKCSDAEGSVLYVTLNDLIKIRAFGKRSPSYVSAIGGLRMVQMRQGIANSIYYGKKGLLQDMAQLSRDWYEPDLSSCVITDGKVNGLLLIHRKPSGILVPSLLYAAEPDARKHLLFMLCFSVSAAGHDYSPGTTVEIHRHNAETRAIAANLFPGAKGEKVIVGERKE